MIKGKVKWFDHQMGYGYITDDRGRNILVYAKEVEWSERSELSKGQDVGFSVVQDQGELIAVNVVRCEKVAL